MHLQPPPQKNIANCQVVLTDDERRASRLAPSAPAPWSPRRPFSRTIDSAVGDHGGDHRDERDEPRHEEHRAAKLRVVPDPRLHRRHRRVSVGPAELRPRPSRSTAVTSPSTVVAVFALSPSTMTWTSGGSAAPGCRGQNPTAPPARPAPSRGRSSAAASSGDVTDRRNDVEIGRAARSPRSNAAAVGRTGPDPRPPARCDARRNSARSRTGTGRTSGRTRG